MRELPRALFIALVLWACQGISFAAQSGAQAETQSKPKWSSAALYNLANAYARTGNLGMAVLNYERAALLAPGDPDVEANLLLVRRSAGLPAEARAPWRRAVADLSPTAASWIGLIGLLLVCAAAFAPQMRAFQPWTRRMAAVAGGALIAIIAANAATSWPRIHEAVVIVDAAPVRIAPAPMGDTLFALKEAEVVRISGEHEGFVLVRASGDRTGWIWHAHLAPVVP